jgi:putative hemolysin
VTTAALLIAVTVLVASLAATSVMSAANAALREVPRSRARRLRDSGAAGAVALERLGERPSRLSAARALVAATSYCAVSGVGVWVFTQAWRDAYSPIRALLAAALGLAIMFSIGEALPRSIALANPEDVGLASAGWAGRLTTVTYPVARFLSLAWTRLVTLITGEPGPAVPWVEPAESLRHTGSDEEDAHREAEDEDLLGAVNDMRSKIVREVMVPRTDMVAIEDTADATEALEAITAAGVSRVPVFHDTLDDVRGVLYAKDLLAYLGRGRMDVRPADIARPAIFVPETKPVDELLREMRSRTHLAIVADEYGGTAGLVTIEDLLEEIVGEIFDEYDPPVTMITEAGDGTFRVDARLPIDEIDERFGTSLEVEADTVGGLVTELAGHIPKAGESVEVEGLRLTVARMEGNRVREIVVEAVGAATDEERDDE